MEPKPFASLSAGLLARKGAARPAMRRPFISGSTVPTLPASVQDDLGWNDMGDDESLGLPPLTMVLTPSPEASRAAVDAPAVVKQQEKLAEQMAQAPAPVRVQPQPAATTPAPTRPVEATRPRVGKAAFTLRLDPERHLRLRLACAVGNRSAQQIVTQALDAFLDSQPQLEALVQQIPADEAKGPAAKSK